LEYPHTASLPQEIELQLYCVVVPAQTQKVLEFTVRVLVTLEASFCAAVWIPVVLD
jgi:hypothetical protein